MLKLIVVALCTSMTFGVKRGYGHGSGFGGFDHYFEGFSNGFGFSGHGFGGVGEMVEHSNVGVGEMVDILATLESEKWWTF